MPQGTSGPIAPIAIDTPRVADSDNGRNSEGARLRQYSVLVGSFRYEPEAASLLDQLRGLGYQARTARVSSTGRGIWHQVFVGPYPDVERARQDEARVRQLPGYADARVVTQ
jgi:cell division septation protein DedD